MSKLPIVDARTFERILLKWGFPSGPAERQSCVLSTCGWAVHDTSTPQRPGHQPTADPQDPQRDTSNTGVVHRGVTGLIYRDGQGPAFASLRWASIRGLKLAAVKDLDERQVAACMKQAVTMPFVSAAKRKG